MLYEGLQRPLHVLTCVLAELQDLRVEYHAARRAAIQVAIDAHFGGNSEHIFSGLNEILEAEAALEECLSTAKLLMSEDR